MNISGAFTTAIAETVAAVLDPSMAVNFKSMNNNTLIYPYDTSAPSGWPGDGGGGGGVGVGVGVDGSGDISSAAIAASSLSGSYSNSYEASGDDYLNSYENNNTRLTNFTGFHYGDGRCHNFDIESNSSYWNVSCDSQIEYIVPLYGYTMPFFLITTLLSNSLIVLILSKKKMSTPTNFVLMTMAIYDMLTVIFPAPGFWYMYTFGNHYKPLNPVWLCYVYHMFNEIVPSLFHTASIWLTLALAVQRYIYVCHAPMAHTWCTMPRVKRCTLYITIAALLHQSTKFFDRHYEALNIQWEGQTVEVCEMHVAKWVDAYIGEDLYFTSYFLFRVIFVHLVPCIMLVTLNILLFSAMRQAHRRRKLLFKDDRKRAKRSESNCTTLMLIVVVTVFLVVEIPIAAVTAMHIVSSLYINFMDYEIANILIAFTNFSLVVSYPINFGIYCGMSRQFRETFKEMIFLRSRITKKDNSSRYSIVNGPRTCTNTTNETVL